MFNNKKEETYLISWFTYLLFISLVLVPLNVHSQGLKPKKLLIYYGLPSYINQCATLEEAAEQLSRYDYLILGRGIEDPNHPDNSNTAVILKNDIMAGTFVFGYVDLGVTNGAMNLSIDDIKSIIDNWKGLDVSGILFDNLGYDFGTHRSRQNEAIEYAHDQGMSVIAGALHPEDIFGDQNDPVNNPLADKTNLDSRDFYLYTGHQIRACQYETKDDWQDKANIIKSFQDEIRFRVLSTTTCEMDNFYDEDMFFYSWFSALLYGHEATGWGEKDFAANDNKAPFYERPVIDPGTYFTTNIIVNSVNSPIYYRETNMLKIFVNTSDHKYGVIPIDIGDVSGSCFVRSLLKIIIPGCKPNGSGKNH